MASPIHILTQIFYDEFADMFLLCGEFKEFDPTNGDGWSTPDISQKLKGIFSWKDNEIIYLDSFDFHKLLGALSDGRYIFANYYYGVEYGGYAEIWDPELQTFTEIDSTSGDFSYVVQIGSELYIGTRDTRDDGHPSCRIYRYDYASQKLINMSYFGDNSETIPGNCTTYRDGLFYSWTAYSYGLCAIRPTGGIKVLFDPSKDIQVTDFNALPDSPSNLLRTSDGTFIFYDENAKAIRAITPNPNYVEPDPPTELISVANQLLVGTWKSEDGIYTMEASLGQAPGFCTIKITGGTSAQTATTITYDAKLNTEDEIIKCFNGKRVDSSRFSEDIIYDGTGEAEIPYLSEDYLTFECHTAQDLKDLFEASVDFYKVTA